MGKTWTISIWMREVFSYQVSVFSVVPVSHNLLKSTTGTQDQFRVQVKSGQLKMLEGFLTNEISMPTDFQKNQWIYIYIFSDETAKSKGFGAYVPGASPEYYEQVQNGESYNMAQHQSIHQMRLGSKNYDNEFVSNLRKLLIFKGTAVHSSSTDSRADLLTSVDCPRLIVTTFPACQGTYFYYKMTIGYLTNANQIVTDSSGNSVDATNGQNSAADSKDCVSHSDGIEFTGSCYIKNNGLSLSSRGFSMEVKLKASISSQFKSVIKEVSQNKFSLEVRQSDSTIRLSIDGVTKQNSGCSQLQSGVWVIIGLSIVANDNEIEFIIACNQQIKLDGNISKPLSFSLSSFHIGDGFIGRMQEFKMYYLALGYESLTKVTAIPEACSSGQFYNFNTSQCEACPLLCTECSSGSAGSCSACIANASETSGVCNCDHDFYKSAASCVACDALCNGCTGAGNTVCEACATGKYLVVGTNTCVTACSDYAVNYFLDGSTCRPCHPLCATCTGVGNTQCTTCASGKYSVEGTSTTCVTACTDQGTNYFLDGSICKQCDPVCATCSGSQAYKCLTCVSKEILDSPLKDPKHCTPSCGSGLYADGANCRSCASNCDTCSSGAVADCSLCLAGYYSHPTTSACYSSCPNGYYQDPTPRTCPQCDIACATCTGSGSSSCLTCSPQYYSSAANECSACDALCDGCTGIDSTSCSACASGIYSIEGTNTCVSACADHAPNYYLDWSLCKQCDPLCGTCSGPSSSLCLSCASGKFAVAATNTCVSACSDYAPSYYLDGSTCRQCDPLCATCTGAGSSSCSSCASGKYLVDGTSTCVSACSDYAANYFLDGSTCKQCDLECVTCSGSAAYNCISCINKEIVNSPFKDPKHCVSTCGAGLYTCASNCETCTGDAVSDCTLCSAGFFMNPLSDCKATCPSPGYYQDTALRTCPPCDPACLTCTGSSPSACSSCNAQYYSSGPNQCSACHPLCDGCTGPDSTSCSACASGKYAIDGTNTCVSACSDHAPNYYLDGSICKQCDPLCATCTGAGNSLCSTCASSIYSVQATTTCVSLCSLYATNYFLDGTTCKPCNSFCATCTGQFEYNCQSCASGFIDLTNSPLSNPKHCGYPCPSGEYHDGSSCLPCSSNCEVCVGPNPADCTLCQPGFFFLPSLSDCVTSCPSAFFPNTANRRCEPCSDSNCVECISDKTICTSCSTINSYYKDGTVCSYCAAPNYTGPDYCSACTLEGYSISETGQCQEHCGDGLLLSPHHQCDDSNTNDGDGCDSSCLIEPGYLCERTSSSSPDICFKIRDLSISTLSINQESFLVTFSFNEAVLIQNLLIEQFTFNYPSLSPEDLEISLSSANSGLQDSVSLQLTPKVSITQEATLSFTLNTLNSFTSIKPYIQVPAAIESPALTLPLFELLDTTFQQTAQNVGQAMSWTTILLLIGMSVSQCVLQSSMESMWVLICINQLISYIPLMSITFPSNMLFLFNILTFFNGEIYLFLLAYDYSVGLFFDFPGETFPYNERFALLGYDSVKLMDNSGIFISIWIFLLFFVLILLLARKICKCVCCVRSSRRLLRCVIWGPILRTFIATFLELGFCSYINIIFISFESAPDIISSSLSLLVFFTLAMLPFVILHILSAPPSTLEKQNYKQKFGEVYKDLDYTTYTAGFYYPIFLLHRYFFISLIFGAFFSGRLQCCLMIGATSFFLAFLIKWKPFPLRLDHFLNIFATIILITLYFICLILSFMNQSSFKKERDIIGYIFISLVIGFFVFACLLVFISKVKTCANKSKQKESMKSQINPEISPADTETNFQINSTNILPRMSMFQQRAKAEDTNYKEQPSILDEFRIKPFGRHNQSSSFF